jgi:hypothetical protein
LLELCCYCRKKIIRAANGSYFGRSGLKHARRETSKLDLESRVKHSAIFGVLKENTMIHGHIQYPDCNEGGTKKSDLVLTRLGVSTSIILESGGRPASTE